MEEIVPLFEAALSPEITDEQRRENTMAIMEICSNPELTFPIIEILGTEGVFQNRKVKISVASALKQSLLKLWEENFQGQESGAAMKQQIPLVFQQEINDSQIISNISTAIIPIIRTDAGEWPELLEFISTSLGKEEIVNNTECLSSIAAIEADIAESAPDEALGAFYESFIHVLKLCLEKRAQNIELCNVSAPILASLFERINSEPGEDLVEIFTEMFSVFVELLNTTDFLLTKLSNAIAVAFNSKNLSGYALEALTTLLGLASSEEFNTNNYTHLFMSIEGIITAYPEQITEELIQEFFQVSYNCAIRSDDDTQSKFIANTIETACRGFDSFYGILMENLRSIDESTDNRSMYISILFFTFSLEANVVYVMQELSDIIELISAFLETEYNDVKLMTLALCKELCDNFMPEQNEFAAEIIEKLVKSLESSEQDIIIAALRALSSAFHSGRMPTSVIAPTLEAIIAIIQSVEDETPTQLLNEATHTAAMIISSVQEEIIPFVEALFPIINKGAEVGEDVDAIRKADCLIALSQMIRYANEQLGENAPGLIQLLLEVGKTEDDYLRQAIVDSFGNLVVVKAPDLENHVEEITELLDFCFGVNVFSPDEENPEETDLVRESAIECLKDALGLIKEIYKEMPSIAPADDPMHYADGVLIIGEDAPSDELVFPAMAAAAYILIRTGSEEVGGRVFEIIGNALNGKSCLAAAGAFHCLRILTKCKFEQVTALFENVIPAALNALLHKLPCQTENEGEEDEEEDDEEDGDFYLIEPVFKFLNEVNKNYPAAIEPLSIVQIGNKVMNNFVPTQKQCYMSLCKTLYLRPDTPAIAKKVIVQQVINGVTECNFTVYPEALVTALTIFNIDPSIDLEKISEKLTEIFDNEPTGERYYWVTAAHAASFICAMMDKSPADFDFETWVPAILSKMPMKGDKLPAEYVYSHLVHMAQSTELCPEEFIRVFALILGQTDKEIEIQGISQATIQGMVQYVKAAGAEVNFEEILSSPQELERFQARCA